MSVDMRVLFLHRKGVFGFEGGEQDQICFLRSALQKIGVTVGLSDSLPPDWKSYDLIHYFGLDQSHIEEIISAINIPKVLTPVFWDRAQGYLIDDQFEEWPRPDHILNDKVIYWFRRVSQLRNRRVSLIYRDHFYITLHNYAEFQRVIDQIDLFLPNSEAEMQSIKNFFVIENCSYRIIPNAVDLDLLDDVSDYADVNLSKIQKFICCSGGIDRRKNQYSLVKALIDVDVPIVFAGSIRDRRYYQAIQRLTARHKHIRFLDHLEKRDLYSVYRAAAVHALPSLHDTPGLANLEAVAHGCVNVGTQIGGLREYLGEYSLYCNPFNINHIKEQVIKALELPRNIEGAQLVRSKFNYVEAAKSTLDAYISLLESKK
jgi:glycosyltransferase involved in cell wall biosynthesis